MITAAQILKRIDSLPAMSPAVGRLQELWKSETSVPADFERVIRTDPALTANVLKMANSAYFGLPFTVSSIAQAVMFIGRKRIYEIAVGSSFSQTLPAELPGYQISSVSFWRHSVAVGMLAERLAVVVKSPAPDLLFTAGLLHDIGKLVICAFLKGQTDEYIVCLRETDITSLEAERRVLGTDHTQVGESLAEKWKLPLALRSAARWHHEPGLAPEGEDAVAHFLVHIADALAHSLGFGGDNAELQRRVEPQAVASLGLKVGMLEKAAVETVDSINEVVAMFPKKA